MAKLKILGPSSCKKWTRKIQNSNHIVVINQWYFDVWIRCSGWKNSLIELKNTWASTDAWISHIGRKYCQIDQNEETVALKGCWKQFWNKH